MFIEDGVNILRRIWFWYDLNCDEKYVCWWFNEISVFILSCNKVINIVMRVVDERRV